VFYELVAGAHPLDFKKAALHDFLKKLREEEPSRPSASIRTRAESARTELAKTHRTALPTLEREIRGDLDAIALKALEKARSHRYSTPSDFAADIRRFLNREPVLAVRPSALYRARKFARRYRVAIATATAFLIVLIAATAVSIRQSIRANREAAMARAISDFLQNDLLVKANPAFQGGQPEPDLRIRTLLDRAAAQVSNKFKNQPEIEAAIRRTIARAYNGLGDYRRAQSNLERAVELFRGTLGPNDPETLEADGLLAFSMMNQGENQKAEVLLGPLFGRSRRVVGREHKATLAAMAYLVRVKGALHKTDEALPLSKELVDLLKRVEGPESFNTLLAMADLGHLLLDQRQYAEAEALLQQHVEIARRVEGPSSVNALAGMNLLGQVYSAEHKYKEAENMLNEVVEASVRTLGPEHSTTIAYMTALANVYTDEKRYPEAEALHLKILALKRKLFPPNSNRTRNSLAYLIMLYERQAKFSQAEPYAVELLAGRRHTLGQNNSSTMDAAADLAEIYVEERKFSAAEPLAREASEWDNKNRTDVWQNYRSKTLLGASLAGQRKFADAEPLLLEGYEGMTARKQKMESDEFQEIDRAARWIAGMYDTWGKPDQASKWRQRPRIAN
jgi:tetratricopeptide (TPR) repeat protein